MKYLMNIFGFIGVLIMGCPVVLIMICLSLILLELITGIDLVRDHLHPFFQGLLK